jgi:MYXO-CTERM domain-containing protein
MRRRALLPLLFPLSLLTLASLLAGCSTEIEDRSAGSASTADASKVRRVSQGIVKGTLDTEANDAVVMINIGTQGSFCTGTLIAPNLVLTAHHCVSTPDETKECGAFSAPTAPAQLTVSVGLQPGNPVAVASKVFVDTGKPNNICGNDIGLFQLDRDITGVTIARVRLTKAVAGEVVTTSGYGDDGTGTVTNGRFVKAGIKVDAVGPSEYSYTTAAGLALPVSLPAGEIGTGESTCFGDSGGPLFDAAGNVIGMTSRGIDGECNDRPSIYTDTASHAAVIMAAATAAGHPLLPATALPGASTGGDTSPQSGTAGGSTSTSSGGTSTGNDSAGGTDDTSDPAPVTKPSKRNVSLAPAANAGCSVAGAGTGGATPRSSSSSALLGLALGAALVVRRSRERRRPS